VTWIVAAAAG
jgi:hypothetical protein